ncbi:MAG: DEAD/DEAH box helicase family protein [Ignavibacteria bacterium]|nr:DEAD/DEAH box helicase family protein [Ignavibacteria bacterium]
MILKNYQEKAVENLLDLTIEALQDKRKRQIPVLLKAPTGSGKTIIIASFLERLAEEMRIRRAMTNEVAFIWIAPNTLHLQSYRALKKFFSVTNTIATKRISDLHGTMELYGNDMLFLNWSSVDKETNVFVRENERNYNLDTLIERTSANGVEILVLIDEAQLSAYTGRQAINVRNSIDAKVEISITATPITVPDYNVIVRRQDVIMEEMIKKGAHLNVDLTAIEQQNEDLDSYLLKKAMQKRDELARTYEKLGNKINPLLLIQLPSENDLISKEDRVKREKMEFYLREKYNITTINGLLSVWLSDSKDKVNLDGIEKPNAMQTVLIFKQAISQGWDCPRAAVLLIYREIINPTFGIQTIGRILRMPEQKHYDEDILNFGYVYTNLQNEVIRFIADNMDYMKNKPAERKAELIYNRLESSFIINDRPSPGFLLSDFEKHFYSMIESEYGISQIPLDKMSFANENLTIDEIAIKNRKVLSSRFWVLEIDRIEIKIPADIYIDEYELNTFISLDASNREYFQRTEYERSEMFDRFCYDSITLLNKSKSWKTMRRVLIQLMEYYFDYEEPDAIKIMLYSPNNAILSALIQKALETYDQYLKEIGNKNRRAVRSSWSVPKERVYSEQYLRKDHVLCHALHPYYEFDEDKQSIPEVAFIKLLESSKELIDWWYKNGDHGKEHFAIDYINSAGELAAFYVDFIVRFKSGNIGLFDTKTLKSDFEAVSKHNALIDYSTKENKKNDSGFKIFASLAIYQEINNNPCFRYCYEKVESIRNVNDLTVWKFFEIEINDNNFHFF